MLFSEPDNKNLPTDQLMLLLHWNEKYKFWYNIWHLQQLLRQCEAEDLFDECQKFATKKLHTAKIFYFTRSLNGNLVLLLALYSSLVIYVTAKQITHKWIIVKKNNRDKSFH